MYSTYDSSAEAYKALNSVAWPVVIKADGLCAGKGVFLAPDFATAKDFVERVMERNELGPGGKRVLLEETLEGEELSFIILTDGKRYARLDFDLAEVLSDVAAGRLDPSKLRWKPGASACVVLASGGYPGRFETGKRIEGLTGAEKITGVKVLHAGTKLMGDAVLTNGGRVLGVTAAAATLEHALAAAYGAASRIHFEGMHYRRDIGAHPTRQKAAGD